MSDQDMRLVIRDDWRQWAEDLAREPVASRQALIQEALRDAYDAPRILRPPSEAPEGVTVLVYFGQQGEPALGARAGNLWVVTNHWTSPLDTARGWLPLPEVAE